MGNVTFHEPLGPRIASVIAACGYKVGGYSGLVKGNLTNIVTDPGIGIYSHDAVAGPPLFGLFRHKARRRWLGTVWFNLARLGATQQRFVIEVNGRDVVEECTRLASQIVEKFDVDVDLMLDSEHEQREWFLSDCDL
jgi:hypothetical protein